MKMSTSIGLSFNAYAEPNALPGMLEVASRFYDELVMISAPPEGRSNDETIAIAEKWGVRVVHSTIDKGFGYVRTQCIRESTCEWVVIQDADERIFWNAWQLSCEGTESWNPDTCPEPKLTITNHGGYDQGILLRNAIENPEVDGIRFVRRHWFDFSMKRPTQNFMTISDWQLRCVRNRPYISYARGMHESIVDSRTGQCPTHSTMQPDNLSGLFFDHFHLFFKAMEPEQRREDIDTYNRLHQTIDMAKEPQEPGDGQNHKG